MSVGVRIELLNALFVVKFLLCLNSFDYLLPVVVKFSLRLIIWLSRPFVEMQVPTSAKLGTTGIQHVIRASLPLHWRDFNTKVTFSKKNLPLKSVKRQSDVGIAFVANQCNFNFERPSQTCWFHVKVICLETVWDFPPIPVYPPKMLVLVNPPYMVMNIHNADPTSELRLSQINAISTLNDLLPVDFFFKLKMITLVNPPLRVQKV